MKIAIPIVNGKVSGHFGHCEVFHLYNTNDESKEIIDMESIVPPAHEPGVLPAWLHELGANAIITGGMGLRAYQLFEENKIDVVAGVTTDDPKKAVLEYLSGSIESHGELCQH